MVAAGASVACEAGGGEAKACLEYSRKEESIARFISKQNNIHCQGGVIVIGALAMALRVPRTGMVSSGRAVTSGAENPSRPSACVGEPPAASLESCRRRHMKERYVGTPEYLLTSVDVVLIRHSLLLSPLSRSCWGRSQLRAQSCLCAKSPCSRAAWPVEALGVDL